MLINKFHKMKLDMPLKVPGKKLYIRSLQDKPISQEIHVHPLVYI